MSALATAALVIGYLGTIIGVLAALWRFWKNLRAIANGQQCQLRSDITGIYYRHNGEEKPTLREYERKNLDDLYEGYKALGGNHYVDDVYNAMRSWRVET